MRNEDVDSKQAELNALLEEIEADRSRRIMRDPSVRTARENQRLRLERELAEVAGEEYAEQLPIGSHIGDYWFVVSVGSSPILACADVGDVHATVFQFEGTEEFGFRGFSADAAVSPLKGLGVYGLFVVRNSGWRRRVLELVPEWFPGTDEAWWARLEHFIVRGRGGEFSCLARGVECRTASVSLDALRGIVASIVKRP